MAKYVLTKPIDGGWFGPAEQLFESVGDDLSEAVDRLRHWRATRPGFAEELMIMDTDTLEYVRSKEE